MPTVVTQRCLEQDLNPRPTDRKPKCLTRCTTASPVCNDNEDIEYVDDDDDEEEEDEDGDGDDDDNDDYRNDEI